jgi:hypothetical protein
MLVVEGGKISLPGALSLAEYMAKRYLRQEKNLALNA